MALINPKSNIKYIGSRAFAIRRFIFYTFIFLVILLVIINGVVKSVQQRSIIPLINEVGGKIIYTTLKLGESSDRILEKGSIFDFNLGFSHGIWQFILDFGDIFGNVVILYYWIRGFYWIYDKLVHVSPFVSLLLTLITFFVIQIMVILLFMALDISLFGVQLSENVIENTSIPFIAIIKFFKVIFQIIISPVAERAGDILVDTNENISDSTKIIMNLTNISNMVKGGIM